MKVREKLNSFYLWSQTKQHCRQILLLALLIFWFVSQTSTKLLHWTSDTSGPKNEWELLRKKVSGMRPCLGNLSHGSTCLVQLRSWADTSNKVSTCLSAKPVLWIKGHNHSEVHLWWWHLSEHWISHGHVPSEGPHISIFQITKAEDRTRWDVYKDSKICSGNS